MVARLPHNNSHITPTHINPSQNHPPRTRRHHPRLPKPHLTPQLKLHPSPLNHQLIMLDPILLPNLPIDLHTLHIIAILVIQTTSSDSQRLVPIDSDVDVFEPGRADEEDWLGYYWVET